MLARWLIEIIKDVHRRTGAPVPTSTVAIYVPRNERTVRGWLADLERCGKVQRVGQRGGWLPA